MLNVGTLIESGVGSSGGGGILSLGPEALSGMIANEEKLDKQVKMIVKQKSKLLIDEAKESENDPEQSIKKYSALKTSQQQSKIDKQLRVISLDELAWHDTPDDCWFAIYDYVYDCTTFIKDHPGGDDVLLEYAGRDATLAFIGAGHSKFAHKTLERYLIGELPENERIFRVPGGVKVYGF